MNWWPLLFIVGYGVGAALTLPAIYRRATAGGMWDESDEIMLMLVSIIASVFWPFFVLAWGLHKLVAGDRTRR